MIRNIIVVLFCMAIAVSYTACSTPDTNDEDSLMALEDEGSEESSDDVEEEVDEADEEAEDSEEDEEIEASTEADEEDEDEELADDEEEEEPESEGFEDFDEDEELEGDDVAEEEGDVDEDMAEEEMAEEELEDEGLEQAADESEPVDEAIEEEPIEEGTAEAEPEGEEFVGDDGDEPPMTEVAGDVVNIQNIQYLANSEGGAVVVKTSGQATYTTRLNAETQQFILEISQSNLPDKLRRPYILKEFDGEFASINAYQEGGADTARIVIQMKSGGEPTVRQEGNSIVVIPPESGLAVAGGDVDGDGEAGADGEMAAESDEVAAAAADDGEAWKESFDQERASKTKILSARTIDEFLLGSNEFFGKPISIQTSDANIREVISFIAAESGVNIVVSDDVKGRLTIKLREVPWDQVLVIVMRAKNLGYVRQGSVLRISTLEKLRQETDEAARILSAQRDLVPLKVKVFPVSYAKVNDLSKKLQPFLTAKRGRVVDDIRTSTVIVTDTEEVLARIDLLIAELDIPPAQVMIEGKIIEASETFKRKIGVNWSMTGTDVTISDDGGFNGSPINIRPSIGVRPIPTDQIGVTVGSIGFNLGVIEGVGALNANLALAQSDNLVKIISSPRVVTTNKVKAFITQQGQVISKASVISNGTVTSHVTRTPVELRLEVTPQITTAGSVIMDVFMKRQFSGPIEDQDSLARAINTREARTQVLVDNGQTAVIAGIFQSDENSADEGLPGLMNLPVVGWLFKSVSRERLKNELMIFLTPRVLKSQVEEKRKEGVEIEETRAAI